LYSASTAATDDDGNKSERKRKKIFVQPCIGFIKEKKVKRTSNEHHYSLLPVVLKQMTFT
jgi:hypothetical protein